MRKPHIQRIPTNQGDRIWVLAFRCCPRVRHGGRILLSPAYEMASLRDAGYTARAHCLITHGQEEA